MGGLITAFWLWVLCVSAADTVAAAQNYGSMTWEHFLNLNGSRGGISVMGKRQLGHRHPPPVPAPSPAPSPRVSVPSPGPAPRKILTSPPLSHPATPKRSKLRYRIAKVLGLVLASIAGVLQIVVFGYLLFKRREMLRLVKRYERYQT